MPLILTDQNGNEYALTVNSVDGSLTTLPVTGVAPSTNDNSINVTAMSLITSALRLIGILASGEQPELSEANDSLMVFNQMLDGWNAERLAIFTTSASDYALILGQQAYTLGPGGDFDTNRPARIDSMSAILLNDPANPIEVPMAMYSVSDWQNNVPVKVVSGNFPQLCYDDGGFPLRTLNMWPIPINQPSNVRIYAWQPLLLVSNLQTSVNFPVGYAEAFRYQLAVRLAAEFGASVPSVVATIAVNALARIKSMNHPDLSLQSDLVPSPAGYNYRADMFGLGF